MVVEYGKKIGKKFVSMLTISSLIAILTMTAISVSACHYTIGTFEDDYETSKNSFFKGEIVYGRGEAIGYNYILKLRIRDPDGNIVYYSNESQYSVYGSFLLNDSAKIGIWNIQLGIYKCGWQWSTESGRISYFSVSDANFTLIVNINGNGSVIKDPDQTDYSYGAIVNISAVAELGWSFSNWTGDINSSVNPEIIIMDYDKSVTANFVEDQYVLAIDIIGNGSVVKDPDLSYYTYGYVVNLTAYPDEGWNFDYWDEDLSGYENPKSIIINDDKNVTAVFSIPEQLFNLVVNIDGDGVVDADKYGPYHYGDIVNLTAIASEGNEFNHWSGDLSGNSNPATINMTENKNVTAHFVILKDEEENGDGDNGDGEVASTSTKKSNQPPVADLSAGELYIGFVNEEIEFDGTLSHDNDGYITEWFWNFGDGTSALGEIATHNYSSPGEYNVILIVTDNNGASDTDLTTAIIIEPNHPPFELNISGPSECFINIEYLFSIVSTDEDNDKIKYTVDWGDGNTDESNYLESGEFFNISHKWTEPGEYQINVSAYDDDTITTIDTTIIIDEKDIPEESNIIIIIILLIGLLLLLLFLLLSKPQKDETEEENK